MKKKEFLVPLLKVKIGFWPDTHSTITNTLTVPPLPSPLWSTPSALWRKYIWQVFLVISFFALSSSESGCTGRIHSDDDDHHHREDVGNDDDEAKQDDEFGSGYDGNCQANLIYSNVYIQWKLRGKLCYRQITMGFLHSTIYNRLCTDSEQKKETYLILWTESCEVQYE